MIFSFILDHFTNYWNNSFEWFLITQRQAYQNLPHNSKLFTIKICSLSSQRSRFVRLNESEKMSETAKGQTSQVMASWIRYLMKLYSFIFNTVDAILQSKSVSRFLERYLPQLSSGIICRWVIMFQKRSLMSDSRQGTAGTVVIS